MNVTVDLINDNKIQTTIDSNAIKNWVVTALKTIKVDGDMSICIKLVNTKEAAELNLKYRKKDTATNVLSFSVDEQLTKNLLIGDIVLCIEIIKKEAKEYSKDFENRLKHMIIHGFLHLLNFNHEAKHERIKMEDLERNIMDTLSAGEPY